MAVFKKTPLKLNLDDNDRLHDQTDMYDALNIRTVSSEDDNAGIVRNTLGNSKVNYELAQGENKVIGTIEHNENNNLFYFIWNNQGNHRIAVYNDITQSINTVLETPLLNFVKNAFVNGFAITKVEDSETLLYFTDDVNPPAKINVESAIAFTSGSGGGYTSVDQQVLDLIQYPPVFPPTVNVVIDNSRGINNLGYGMFQFRYRYFYDDAETSAFSPVSEVAISNFLLRTNVFERNSRDDYNAIDITIKNGSQECRKIEVVFRDSNKGEWKILDIYDNDTSNVGKDRVIRFYNSGNFGVSDPIETNKLYDAVPITAATQEYLGKRNIMANAVDGYDNLEKGVLEDGLTITPRHLSVQSAEIVENPITKETTYNPNTLLQNKYNDVYTVDFSGNSLDVGTYVYLSISSVFFDYTVKNGDTLSDIVSFFYDKFWNTLLNKGLNLFKNVSFNSTSVIFTTINYSNDISDIGGNWIVGNREIQRKSYYVEALNTIQSFKSGATHDFGIVFSDRGNRSQTVQKKDESGVYVNFFNERSGNSSDNGLYGATQMDWSLDITPPLWATQYQFVYTGNTSIDRFLQFNCARVYKTGLPNNPNSQIGTDYIYVSMRNFSGKKNSYDTESILEYQYAVGDRVRVISYWDSSLNTRVYPEQRIDFEVAGYEFFQNNSSNPILNNSGTGAIDSTTGWFLILKQNDVEGWNADSITSSSSGLWCSDGLNSAFFEIYNPQKENNNSVFYEFSQSFPVNNAGTSGRTLGGQLRSQGEDVTVVPSGFSVFSKKFLDFTDRPALVIGDVVTMTGTSSDSTSYTVSNILEKTDGDWRVYFSKKINTSSIPTSVVLQTKTAAGFFDQGDVWWKPRKMYDGTHVVDKDKQVVLYAEDFNASDFFDSANWSKGRVNAFSEYSAQVRRKASVWYSEPYFPDVAFNGLSSFNLSLTPYVDYESSFGAIKLVKRRGDTLVIYQEEKVGTVSVGKKIIESASGSSTLTLTDDVLSESITYYLGDFGIGNQPESWSDINGTHYFVSLKRGAALKIGGDGITQISKYKAFDYFRDKAKEYTTLYDRVKIHGGSDVEYSEYVCSFPSITKGNISVGGADVGYTIPNSSEDINNIYVTVDLSPIYMGMQPSLKWSTEIRNWENICENWEDWGNLLVDLEKVVSDGFLAYDFSQKDTMCLVKLTANNTVYYAQATIDYSSGVITIPKNQSCAGFTLDFTADGETSSTTIGFNQDNNVWTSFYSFIPEFYGKVNFKMISFLNGEFWIHNSNETRCNFYGVQYPHRLGVYMNQEPSAVKMFQAISLEGNKNAWGATMSTNLGDGTNNQTTIIDTTFFEEREGFFYSDIPFATVGSTTSNIISLGVVSSVNGSDVVFAGLESGTGISVGDEVFENNASIGTITAIDGNTITMTSVSGISVGDFLYVSKPAQFYGDVMRGRVLDVLLESSETNVNDLFAVDVIAKNSSYHNV